MRPPFTQFWLAFAMLAFASATARGQYGDPLPPEAQGDAGQYYYSRPGPVAIDEPQQLRPLPALEARPIDDDHPAFPADRDVPLDRHSAPPRSPFPVTLARAEELDAEPVALGDPEGAVTPLKLSPRSERTTDSPARPMVPTPANAVGTVAGSLGIVLGLFLVIVWISRRFAPAGSAMLPKEAVELLGRAPLVGRHQAQLVRVGNKLLLVALTPAGCETLTEVTEPTEVEHLLALCRRSRPGSSTAAFNQVLGQLASEPSRGGFAGPTRPPSRGAA